MTPDPITFNTDHDITLRNERLEQLAAFVEKLSPEQLGMHDWRQETRCGTVACLAGWTPTVAGAPLHEDLESTVVVGADGKPQHVGYFAADWLGLDECDQSRLFYVTRWPDDFRYLDPDRPTPADAAARIRHFIATGK